MYFILHDSLVISLNTSDVIDRYDNVMLPCWNSSPATRPSFADVINTIETSLSGGAEGDEYYYDNSKQEQDNAEDDGLYQNNLVLKPK